MRDRLETDVGASACDDELESLAGQEKGLGKGGESCIRTRRHENGQVWDLTSGQGWDVELAEELEAQDEVVEAGKGRDGESSNLGSKDRLVYLHPLNILEVG